ncbi:MAG: hypothetical protein JWM19_3119 [Actinomycetia bacterium]|nr:hypothetical protein [Actinomycetes bacterium]
MTNTHMPGGGVPLDGDGVTPGIVRVGDTVRRPVRPFTATVQAYLAHLQQAGFAGAPVPLGLDEQGREILPFVYHLSARAVADVDPVFRRFWEQGAKDELPRAEAWLEQAAPAITRRLSL